MEGGADALAAGDADIAVHHFRQAFAQRQPEAGAAELAAHRGIGLGKGLEQPGDAFLGQADARVLDVDVQTGTCFGSGMDTDAQFDLAGGGELDGIGEQIHQDLLDPQGVADQYVGYGVVDLLDQLEAFFAGAVVHHGTAALDQRAQTEGTRFEFQAVGGNLRQIKQVVDDAGETLAGAGNLVEVILLTRIGADAPGQFRQADHRIQWRAQFVADIGEEGVLGLIGHLGGCQRGTQIGRALAHQIFQVRPMLLQFIFDFFALGDVFLDRQIMRRLSLVIVNRQDGGFFPEQLAILSLVAQPATPFLAGQQGLPKPLIDLGRRFTGLEKARILANGFIRCVAGVLDKPRIDVLDEPFEVGNDDRDRALLDGLQQLVDFLLGLVALGNVRIHPDAAFLRVRGIEHPTVQCAVEQRAILVLEEQLGAEAFALGVGPVGIFADGFECPLSGIKHLG